MTLMILNYHLDFTKEQTKSRQKLLKDFDFKLNDAEKKTENL